MDRSRPPEIRALTGVRAIAAWWVVLYHMQPVVGLLPWGIGDVLCLLAGAGYMGVDLFFILSGFILSYNYAGAFESPRSGPYRRFLWMRLARIYPVHLFTLVALGVLHGLTRMQGFELPRAEQFTTDDFVRNLLLVQAWEMPIRSSWNGPAWSISAEWLAYLAFPVVARAAGAARSPRQILSSVAVLLAPMIAICSLIELPTTLDLGLVRLAAEFATGCLLFRLSSHVRGRNLPWDRIASALLVTTVLASAGSQALGLRAFWVTPAFAAVVFALSRASRGLAAVLSSRPLLYWGRVSYSLYMTHYFFVLAMIRLQPDLSLDGTSAFERIAFAGAWFGLVALVAIGTFRTVEEPARRWMVSWVATRRVLTTPLPVETGR